MIVNDNIINTIDYAGIDKFSDNSTKLSKETNINVKRIYSRLPYYNF